MSAPTRKPGASGCGKKSPVNKYRRKGKARAVNQRKVKLQIGVNGAFLTRRWEEPENFLRLTRETGYRVHSFCGDVLDPFFSGDKAYQLVTAKSVKEAAARHGVSICDIYTGVATHRFHGLSHSNPAVRNRMKTWIEETMDLAGMMGVSRIGGHWDAFSIEVMQDKTRTDEAWRRLVETFRALSVVAKEKGLAAIYNEQMYIPSEKPWTLAEADRFLLEVNRDRHGVPIRLTLDVGHNAGEHYGASGLDLNYLEWLRRFAATSEIIHVQQTTPDASHHWPFKPEYNKKGHIRIPEMLEAIRRSHVEYASSPLAGVLEPVAETYLIVEYIPGSTITEERIISDLSDSAEYLHQYIPPEGMELRV